MNYWPVVVILNHQISVMFIVVITNCNCANDTDYVPYPFYAHQPQVMDEDYSSEAI